MDTIRNVTQLLIGKDISATASDGDVISVPGDLADGEVVLCTPQNVVTDGTDAFTKVKFIQRSGNVLIHSDIIDLGKPAYLNNYSIGKAAAEAEQLDFVGWNGVAGDITGVASNIYTIRLNILDKTTAGFMQQKIKEGFYKSNANAASYTPQAIAEALVTSLVKNYSRETEQDIRFELVNGGARTAATGTGNVTFTQGSKFISATTAIDAVAAVGDLIGEDDTSLQAPLYRIVSMDLTAETAVLDRPFQEGTTTALEAAVAIVAAATATAAGWGVRIEGQDREFKAGYFWSNVCFWDTQVDFGDLAGAVLVTKDTAAYPGVGTGDYIANLEGELQADEFIYRGFPEAGVVNRTDAIAGSGIGYDVQVIEHEHNLEAAQGTPTKSPKTLMIAWDATAAQGATVVGYWQALLTLLGIPYTDQSGNLTT